MTDKSLDEISAEIDTALANPKVKGVSADIPFAPVDNVIEEFRHPEYKSDLEIPPEHPSTLSRYAHETGKYNFLAEIYENHEKQKAFDVGVEEVPQSWHPGDKRDYYISTSSEYWPVIFNAKGPKEQAKRFQWALAKTAEDDLYKDDTFGQKAVGFVGGGLILNPINALPFAAVARSVKYGTAMVDAALVNTPSIVGTAAIDAGAKYATDPDMTKNDFLDTAYIDTVAGLAFIGLGAGIGRGYEGGKLWANRRTQNLNSKGISLEFKLNNKSEITGYDAVLNNHSVGAAESGFSEEALLIAQEEADAAFKRGGLFFIPGVTKAASLLSNYVRGTSSKFPTVAKVMQRMASSSIATTGGRGNMNLENTFEDLKMISDASITQNSAWIKGKRAEYYGMTLFGKAKDNLHKFFSKGKQPLDQFDVEVATTLASNQPHISPIINEVANSVKKDWESAIKAYQRAHDFPEEIQPTLTAKGYFPHNWDREELAINKSGYINLSVATAKTGDAVIERLNGPLQAIDKEIYELERRIRKGTNLESSRVRKKEAVKERRDILANIDRELRDNPNYHKLLVERIHLSSPEAKDLKALFKPIKEMRKQNKIEKNKARELEKKRKKLIAELEKPAGPNVPTPEYMADHQQLTSMITDLEKEIIKVKLNANKFERDAQNAVNELANNARAGKLNPAFFRLHPVSKKVVFRNPNKSPKFRPVFEDVEQMREVAESTWVSLSGLSDKQLAAAHTNELTGQYIASPVKKRSIMLNTEDLIQHGFIRTKIDRVYHDYLRSLSTSTLFEESMRNLNQTNTKIVQTIKTSSGTEEIENFNLIEGEPLTRGEQAVFNGMAKDFNTHYQALENKKLPPKKLRKEQVKLIKEFSADKQFMKEFLLVMQGRNNSNLNPTTKKVFAAMRDLAASVRLGNVPLTQITDLMANTFKHGMIPFIRDGLGPAIKTFNGRLGTKNAKHYRQVASEAHLALEQQMDSMLQKFDGYDTFSDQAPLPIIGSTIRNAAIWSQRFSLANTVENFNQSLTAQIAQSKIVQFMEQYKKGKLSQNKINDLERLGIHPDKWADQFVEQSEKFGKKGIFGGRQSYFYEWDNDAAKVKMANAVFIATRDTIIKRGRSDLPLWLNNEYLGVISQFMGWSFAAFNRYTIPLLQRGEANMILGTAAMSLTASTEGMLRKWSRGEEVDLEDENFIAESLGNSAVTSIIYKAAMFSNLFLSTEALEKLKNDKYRGFSFMGAVSGPAFGVLDDYLKATTMFTTQQLNKKEFSRLVLSLPGTQSWMFRRLQNQFIDAVTDGWPETRQDARDLQK